MAIVDYDTILDTKSTILGNALGELRLFPIDSLVHRSVDIDSI